MKRHQVRQGERVRRNWRSALASASAIAAALALAPAALAQQQTSTFDIESQPLSSALLAFGRQARLSVLAPSEFVSGKMAPAVRGDLSASAALERLLEGSGLTFQFVQANAVRIVRTDQANLSPDTEQAFSASGSDENVDRIVVTGTTLTGLYPASSPIEVYSAEDISRTGAVTTEQFISKLPQNLGTISQYAAGSTTAGFNYDGVTAVDLRGLGVGTTLALLNGHRMSLSNSGQSADVSMIPASAIARVEVLTDGASAIYGSDAIGGVINFVLRDDFEGAESRLSYGGVTSGGLRQGDASQLFGTRWANGHGLISYNFHSASALQRIDRDYSAPAGRGTLTPTETRHNFLAVVSQNLTDKLSLDAQFGFGRRGVKNEVTNLVNPVPVRNFQSYRSETDQYFGDIALDYQFSSKWAAKLAVTYSEVAVDGERFLIFFNRVPPLAPIPTNFSTSSTVVDAVGKIEGTLFSLPGGDLRFSLGAGLLDEKFQGYSPISSRQSTGALGRQSPYAFVELFAPFVSPSQEIPLIHRLELSLAARYTDYRDTSSPSLGREFGDSVDPKVGVFWAPAESLGLRATYGTSFRAPSLSQLDPTGGSHFLTTSTIGGVPNSIYLGVSGYAVPELGPETATTYTAGFDYRSLAAPGLRLAATYYNIDYTDRIGIAPFGGLDPFATPQRLPDIIYHPPSAALIEDVLRATALSVNTTAIDLSNPTTAAQTLFAMPDLWIFDVRYKNLALSKQDGIDLSASYAIQTPLGEARLGADVTHILSYKQQGSPTDTVRTAVGIPGSPLDWRARVRAGLSRGAFDGSISLNLADSYANPLAPAGRQRIDSWRTVDLNLSYDFGAGSGGRAPRLTLSAQNIFDEDPPLLNTGVGANILYPIGFDPANANPLGRFVVVGLIQKW